jgi:hypothetical protein
VRLYGMTLANGQGGTRSVFRQGKEWAQRQRMWEPAGCRKWELVKA